MDTMEKLFRLKNGDLRYRFSDSMVFFAKFDYYRFKCVVSIALGNFAYMKLFEFNLPLFDWELANLFDDDSFE